MAVTGLTIWFNPRCSKSRQTLTLLQKYGHRPMIRLYLTDPPTIEELQAVLSTLDQPISALLRTKEKRFAELNLSLDMVPDTLLSAMAENPILIERPLVLFGAKAAIGRPAETVLSLF